MENINASILILKTGNQIICTLQEVFDGEGEDRKAICLLMTHPYELSMFNSSEDPTQDVQIKFTKWCPYSADYQFKIPYDSVMAVGISDSGLQEVYASKIETLTKIANQNAQLQQEEISKVINPEVMPNE
jgi:hypothetical protein